MLKKVPNFVLGRPSSSTYRSEPTEGKVTIRSHMIEASGSSEAWYVPPQSPGSLRPRWITFLNNLRELAITFSLAISACLTEFQAVQ
jgi:hypothetical protein